jgi:hypothetical protein
VVRGFYPKSISRIWCRIIMVYFMQFRIIIGVLGSIIIVLCYATVISFSVAPNMVLSIVNGIQF